MHDNLKREIVERLKRAPIWQDYVIDDDDLVAIGELMGRCSCLPLPEPDSDDCPVHGES